MYTLMISDDDPRAVTHLSRLVDFEALGFRLLDAHRADDPHAPREMYRPDALICRLRGAPRYAVVSDALEGDELLDRPVSAAALTALLLRLRGLLERSQALNGHAIRDALLCLLDGDASLTVSAWNARLAKPLTLDQCRICTCAAPREQLDALRGAIPEGAFLLPTGPDKVSILCDAQASPLPDGALPVPCGMSETASPDSSLLELYRQSDIAYVTARFFRRPAPVLYQPQTLDDWFRRTLEEIAQALDAGNDVLCRSLLSALQRRLSQWNAAVIAEAYNRLCELFEQHAPDRFPAAPQLDYRRLGLDFASPDALFAGFYAFLDDGGLSGKLQFDEVLRMIDANFTHRLRIKDLAQSFRFSSSYFSTLFRERVGMTFTQYVAEKRIALVRELLGDESLSLQQIAEQTGFCDYFQLCKVFKKHTGLTPGAYRKQLTQTPPKKKASPHGQDT